jgi:hypothetical protein
MLLKNLRYLRDLQELALLVHTRLRTTFMSTSMPVRPAPLQYRKLEDL